MTKQFETYEEQGEAIEQLTRNFLIVCDKHGVRRMSQFLSVVDHARNECPPPCPFDCMVAMDFWQCTSYAASRAMTAAARKIDAVIRAKSKQEQRYNSLIQRR